MRYRDLLIVERRRSEKGRPRLHKDKVSDAELEEFKENAVKELSRIATESGIELQDLYVTYTGLDKIGINPRSGYNTPIGVYCYPLGYVLDQIKKTNDPGDVPYMGNQPHIWVFTPKNPGRGLDVSSYTEEQLNADMEKIKNFLLSQGMTEANLKEIIEGAYNSAKQLKGATLAASQFWNTTRELGSKFGKIKNKKFGLKVGSWVLIPDYTGWYKTNGVITKIYSGYADIKVYNSNDNSFLHQFKSIPLEDLKAIKPPSSTAPLPQPDTDGTPGDLPDIDVGDKVLVLKGPFEGFDGIVTKKDHDQYLVNFKIFGKNTPAQIPASYLELVQKNQSTIKKSEPPTDDADVIDVDAEPESGPFSFSSVKKSKPPTDDDLIDLDFEPEPDPYEFSKTKKESVIKEEMNAENRAKTASIEWNRLMRVAGYDYIVDSDNAGLIHPSEPTQAVFLSGAYITPIERIRNTSQFITPRPPYTPFQINQGKYDPVTFERWLKTNYKKYQPGSLNGDSVKISSEKLIKALISHDADWVTILDIEEGIYADMIVAARSRKLADLLTRTDDTHDINDSIESLEKALKLGKGDISASDKEILNRPKNLINYIKKIKKGQWKEAEPIILKDPITAYEYAYDIIRGPWPPGELIISKTPKVAYLYAEHVLKSKPFKRGEESIRKDPYYASVYATEILKKPWPEAEDTIALDANAYLRYRNKFPIIDDVTTLKPGEYYIEVVREQQNLVLIANPPDTGEKIEVHNMFHKAQLKTIYKNYLKKVTKNRQGFTLGDRLIVDKMGKTALFVGASKTKYYFLKDHEILSLLVEEVIDLNPDKHTVPQGFEVGDIVEFKDPYDFEYENNQLVGSIYAFPEYGKVEVVGYSTGHQILDISDIKHYDGKNKK